MACPKCGGEPRTKAGFVGDKRRWRCKTCGCKYTRGTPPGLPMAIKRLALQLYLEGLGFRAIGRVLGASNVAVLKWICAFGEAAERCRKPGPAPKIAMIDEAWHFIQAKKTKPGPGCRCVISRTGSQAFIWVVEAPRA